MTLVLTRKHFVEDSGRFDLVVDYEGGDYSDNGADRFITAGQRWLDRRTTHLRSHARYYKNLSLGDWYALVPEARAITAVWFSNSDGDKWKLEKKSLEEIRATFANDPADVDNADPLVYTPVSLRTIPEVDALTKIDQFGGTSYTTATANFAYNGLLWMAPAGSSLVLEVHGLFRQFPLVDDADMNYWTEEEEAILVMAACRQLEISYRNAQGVKDWETAVDSALFGLEADMIEEESAEITQMEG